MWLSIVGFSAALGWLNDKLAREQWAEEPADSFERGLSAFTASFSYTGVTQWKFHISKGGQTGKQIEALKDKSNFAIADTCKLVVVHFSNRLTIKDIVT